MPLPPRHYSIFAEHDSLTPPSVGESMARQLPNASLEVVGDAGHLVNIEQPEKFNRLLLPFLLEHRSRAN